MTAIVTSVETVIYTHGTDSDFKSLRQQFTVHSVGLDCTHHSPAHSVRASSPFSPSLLLEVPWAASNIVGPSHKDPYHAQEKATGGRSRGRIRPRFYEVQQDSEEDAEGMEDSGFPRGKKGLRFEQLRNEREKEFDKVVAESRKELQAIGSQLEIEREKKRQERYVVFVY